MCGIAGQWRIERSGDSAALGASTQAMTAALAHRGPDAGDVWLDPNSGIALGHRRLSILKRLVIAHVHAQREVASGVEELGRRGRTEAKVDGTG